MKKQLILAEKFYSIQGEGQTIGTPAVFVRLGGCNLLCKSNHWTCDSIEVWKHGKAADFETILTSEDITKLFHKRSHLIFTGGEPLLHQEAICDYLKWLTEKIGCRPIVEVETNGTIIPSERLCRLVHYWNVSPKLGNSGETFARRVNEVALKTLNSQPYTCFKFVVDQQIDVFEILEDFVHCCDIDIHKVYLMPAADNQESLFAMRLQVMEWCKSYGLKFTDRLHITTWNKKTGV